MDPNATLHRLVVALADDDFEAADDAAIALADSMAQGGARPHLTEDVLWALINITREMAAISRAAAR